MNAPINFSNILFRGSTAPAPAPPLPRRPPVGVAVACYGLDRAPLAVIPQSRWTDRYVHSRAGARAHPGLPAVHPSYLKFAIKLKNKESHYKMHRNILEQMAVSQLSLSLSNILLAKDKALSESACH